MIWEVLLKLALLGLPEVVKAIRKGLEDHEDESERQKIEKLLPPESANK